MLRVTTGNTQAGCVIIGERAAESLGAEQIRTPRQTVSVTTLVPRVVDVVSPRPVAAAGGIADGRGLVAVLALDAQAAVLGTRFLASSESRAHRHYKQKVLEEASEADTVRTVRFGHGWPDAPHRTLRTAFSGVHA